jgi:geranylgeranyl pyrophosphate synthase
MLMHFMRTAKGATRARALRILRTPRTKKRADDVAWLLGAMTELGSLEYGRAMAAEYSARALEFESQGIPFLRENDDRRFLREMLRYVIDRLK